MTLDKASKVAELVGAIAVVVGLIFVGLEVRDNTRAQRFNNTQSLVSDYNKALQSFVEAEFSCVLMKGYEDFGSLDPVEKIEFSSQMLQFLRVYEQMYYTYLDGGMDAEVFDGFTEQFRETLRAQGLREYLDQRNKWFGSRFRNYIEQLTDESDAITAYYNFSGCDP